MKSRDKPRPSIEDRTIELARWVDDRFGVARFGKTTLNKIFPDHWSFLLGEIAMYSFVIIIITGIFLTLFFVPSTKEVVYHGSYVPLRGQRVSEAYQSTVDISLNVRAGLVMRQMHHWAADIFAAAIVVHLCRIFFTGAFRRPRELNYMIGLTMLILVIVNGFIGYSLPDDQISGAGLRIAYSIFLSIPIVGTWGAFLLWGGNFPGDGSIIPRFYSLHILILPAVIAILLGAHLGIMWHQKHTDFPGKDKSNRRVTGSSFWPTYTAKTVGYFFIIFGGTALLGGLLVGAIAACSDDSSNALNARRGGVNGDGSNAGTGGAVIATPAGYATHPLFRRITGTAYVNSVRDVFGLASLALADDMPEDALIIVPVRKAVLFPGVVFPLTVERERSRAAAQEAGGSWCRAGSRSWT